MNYSNQSHSDSNSDICEETFPLVSVIVPAYNTERYISQAIASALDQTLENLEVIVVDDSSTDGTLQRLRQIADPRLKIFQNPSNSGAAAARNLAIQQARGKWIAVLDSDDWYTSERLETLVNVAEQHNADMVADDLWYVEDKQATPWSTHLTESKADVAELTEITATYFVKTDVHGRPGLHLGLSKPIIRREFLNQHQLRYDETVWMGHDFFLYLDCLVKGAKFFLYAKPLYFYRARADSLMTKSQVNRLSQAVAAANERIKQPDFRAVPKLNDAFQTNLITYKQNLAYYRVVDPLKNRQWGLTLKALIQNPYFWVRFAQRVPQSLIVRIKHYLLGDRTLHRRGTYGIGSKAS